MAFVHVMGGDGSDVVNAVVLHWFEMRRKKKKKKKGKERKLILVGGRQGRYVPAMHVRAGAMGWLACPQRVA